MLPGMLAHFGVVGTCNDCFPSLSREAATLATTNSVAIGKWERGQHFEVTASGTLTRIPLAQVTFERIAGVVDRAYVEEFKLVGGDMVRSVDGSLTEPTTIPPGKTFYACERVTSYKLDWFVDRAKVVRHGLRNMSIVQVQTCCREHGPGMCELPTCF